MLSRQALWRYKWTRMKALVADEYFSKKFAKIGAFDQHGLIRIINQVLLLHEGPILKFDLYMPNTLHDNFPEINRWMLLLSRKGVRDLTIVNLNQRYQLPSYLFSCMELRKLKLVNCFFKPPLEHQEFLYLNNLFLKNIDFGSNLSETVINLPRLVTLNLSKCTNIYNFNIKATKLQGLIVDSCPDAMLHRLLHSQCLYTLYIFIRKPVENLVQVERMNLPRIPSNINNLGIDGYFVKYFIAENIPKWLPHALNSLTRLNLLDFAFGEKKQLECALCLLRNSPNLKSLWMWHGQMKPQDMNFDVGLASNHLESPGCLDQTLNRLQTVKIKYLQSSRPGLLFVKLLLAHSPSLEKMTIQPSQTLNAIKRLNIATDIMRFPRASPKAEVIFLNSNS